MMAEIGRLREFSFRKVGEGTGLRSHLDHFNCHYKHRILWDDKDLELVGACRIAETDKLLKPKSIKKTLSC